MQVAGCRRFRKLHIQIDPEPPKLEPPETINLNTIGRRWLAAGGFINLAYRLTVNPLKPLILKFPKP